MKPPGKACESIEVTPCKTLSPYAILCIVASGREAKWRRDTLPDISSETPTSLKPVPVRAFFYYRISGWTLGVYGTSCVV